jgi:hypothetical protein
MQSQMTVTPVEIVIVLDRSGSMECCRDATISGFNEFLQAQRVAGVSGFVSLYQFDDIYEVVYEGKSLSEAPRLSRETFVPRGYTALYDAMASTLRTMQQRITGNNRVVFVTVTDGGENHSKEFKHAAQVKELVEKARSRGWECVFIGANQDAILTANTFGINQANAMTYTANTVGTTKAFRSLSTATANYSTGVAASVSFSQADRDAQEAAKKSDV